MTAEDWAEIGLAVAGCIPGLGTITSVGEALLEAYKGNYVDAGIKLSGAIPYAGTIGRVQKLASKGKIAKKIAKVLNAGKKGGKLKKIKGKGKKTRLPFGKMKTKGKRVQTDTGKAIKDAAGKIAKVKKAGKAKKFYRSKSERRKALLRDANDPNSGLSPEAREYIKKTKGNNVPKGYEVSHEKPLYTGKTVEQKKELDKMDNMKTQEKKFHRSRHKECGDQYHDYPR
ncbi:hypothetical protein [Anaerosinus massiliensis]|uniref:hypothetical protein n=1 Tax=Massilibacillus massiliensis TaxID=1806837 RepID=UPI000B21CF1F|nr:hypothetical protein [Massilibacillus massiliensis]